MNEITNRQDEKGNPKMTGHTLKPLTMVRNHATEPVRRQTTATIEIKLAPISCLCMIQPSLTHAQDEIEREFWVSVNCDSEAEVRAYIETYPDGAYMEEALECIGDDGASVSPQTSNDQALQGATILNGEWGDSNGNRYRLENGRFFRNDFFAMALDCRQNVEKKTITPVYDCSGDWYNNKGEADGSYQGKLYLYQGKKWRMDGRYNRYSKPEDWYGWSFSQLN
jgi:hypothetical protein